MTPREARATGQLTPMISDGGRRHQIAPATGRVLGLEDVGEVGPEDHRRMRLDRVGGAQRAPPGIPTLSVVVHTRCVGATTPLGRRPGVRDTWWTGAEASTNRDNKGARAGVGRRARAQAAESGWANPGGRPAPGDRVPAIPAVWSLVHDIPAPRDRVPIHGQFVTRYMLSPLLAGPARHVRPHPDTASAPGHGRRVLTFIQLTHFIRVTSPLGWSPHSNSSQPRRRAREAIASSSASCHAATARWAPKCASA